MLNSLSWYHHEFAFVDSRLDALGTEARYLIKDGLFGKRMPGLVESHIYGKCSIIEKADLR